NRRSNMSTSSDEYPSCTLRKWTLAMSHAAIMMESTYRSRIHCALWVNPRIAQTAQSMLLGECSRQVRGRDLPVGPAGRPTLDTRSPITPRQDVGVPGDASDEGEACR